VTTVSGLTYDGEAVFGLTPGYRPLIHPHRTTGFNEGNPVGSIKVNLTNVVGFGWRFHHESEWRDSGDIATDLGIGKHLVTFKDVGGKPDDLFLEVETEGQLVESTIAYP